MYNQSLALPAAIGWQLKKMKFIKRVPLWQFPKQILAAVAERGITGIRPVELNTKAVYY